jgi:hypothetical protein
LYNDGGGTIACIAILANKTLQLVVDDYEMVAVDHGSTAEPRRSGRAFDVARGV